MTEDEDRMHAEGDMRTLMEARRIQRDGKRLKAAMACAKEHRDMLDGMEKDNI